MMPKRENKDTPILIIMGNDSDHAVMRETTNVLDEFGVGYELKISSAHRSPKKTVSLVEKTSRRGTKRTFSSMQ